MNGESLSKYDQVVRNLVLRHKDSKLRLNVAANTLAECEDAHKANKEAHVAIQQVATSIQQKAHDRIAAIVTRCLKTVFEEDLEFRIFFETKANRTEARLAFVKDGKEVDPMEESGGGLVDVAAFAVRLSCLLLAKPPLRKLLILDEPFRFLSREYRERMKDLLLTLSSELGVQFIIVTHIEEFRVGTVVELQ